MEKVKSLSLKAKNLSNLYVFNTQRVRRLPIQYILKNYVKLKSLFRRYKGGVITQ